jgi:GT2 family glycosyltransferase
LQSVTRYAPPETEIVVIDDGSQGECVSAAACAFPEVRVIRFSRPSGFCEAVNAGIAAARGEIVELLNDDTEVTAGWAERALRCFVDATVAAVAPLVVWASDPRRVDSAGDRYFVGGVAGKRGHGEQLTDLHLRPSPVFGASGSSAFYRRDALSRVGGFPDFGAYFEDVDVAFRLHRAGYRVLYEPSSRVLHRVSSSYGKPRRRLLEQQSCNEERVFWRNLPGRVLWRALPTHAGVLLAKAYHRWRCGELIPFLCGRLRLLGELPALARHRRELARWGSADWDAWGVEANWWGKASRDRQGAGAKKTLPDGRGSLSREFSKFLRTNQLGAAI